MAEQQSNEKQKGDELRLLYTACVSEIASFKQQQWQITNYGLLLYATIVSIPKLLATLNHVEYFVLFAVAFGILAFGWFLLGLLASSIQLRRERLTEARKQFTPDFMKAWRGGKPEAEARDKPEDKVSLLWFFRAVLVVGFGAACWLLVRYACAT